VIQNLIDPVILFFLIGVFAGLLKTDLKLPEAIYDALSIYLLLAIGYKGGIELSRTDLTGLILPILSTLSLGIVIPLVSYLILSRLGKFGVADSAAIAAHYGSVSAVTFAVAVDFLGNAGIAKDEFMTVLLVMLEIPAIAVGILLVRFKSSSTSMNAVEALREVFLGKSIYLLIGGIVVGYFAGLYENDSIKVLFNDMFRGFLAFFLLEMGIIASKRFADFKRVGTFLIGFGIVMPLISAIFGIATGVLCGLTQGGTFVLACMAASASYIAAPTAMRIAVPEANPTYYITASLGITFPFNIVFGIYIYYSLTNFVYNTLLG
jgi:hypothetical protein